MYGLINENNQEKEVVDSIIEDISKQISLVSGKIERLQDVVESNAFQRIISGYNINLLQKELNTLLDIKQNIVAKYL